MIRQYFDTDGALVTLVAPDGPIEEDMNAELDDAWVEMGFIDG